MLNTRRIVFIVARPEFPDSPDTQVARRLLAVTVPARQVLLLSIQPSP
jgi:hypothetical protein